MLGCEAPGDLGCGVGDVDDYSRWRWVTGVRRIAAGGWVATIRPELGEWWQGWHGVLVAGGGGDGEFIGGAAVTPAAVFFALVASSA